jgi:hypothetical protein
VPQAIRAKLSVSTAPGICIIGRPQGNHDTGFTYADYLTWPEGERWELIAKTSGCRSSTGWVIFRYSEIITEFSLKRFKFRFNETIAKIPMLIYNFA